MAKFDRMYAEGDWKHARRKVLYDEVVCLIRRCSVNMLSFEDVRADLHLQSRVDRGLQTISLDHIRGSVGRYDDFTAAFLPRKNHLQERWINVDLAMRQGKTPPIDVYKVGDAYFVMDGNHRVSSAKQQGLDYIDAYVTEFVTPVELSAEADFDELLVKAEQAAFLQQTGRQNAETAQAMVFTCSGCYQNVSKQVEQYRLSAEAIQETSVPPELAFKQWHDEVYAPAINAIRHNNLLDQFPDRTEADLFIWTQENSLELEDLEGPDARV